MQEIAARTLAPSCLKAVRAHPLHEFLADLQSLVLPCRCLGCGRFDRLFCVPCTNAVRALTRFMPLETTLAQPLALPVFSAGAYASPGKDALIGIKHEDMPGLAKVLRPVFEHTIETTLCELRRRNALTSDARVLFVPLPSRASKVRQRGFDHLSLLLRDNRFTRKRTVRALRAGGARSSQVGLDHEARLVNSRRLKVTPAKLELLRHQHIRVVLVDDVCTSGATLTAAAQILATHGVSVSCAVTLFRVEIRDSTV
ncbi:hypothetical protein KJY78_05455 [Canibacter sp. lx-45]|uniref:ComF family protein n=1 Tax=Canibacter zhuwentaonis TaxID=2837491 RepID=UPI001BDCD82E|nr:phosphoribosyltransferase family protein [Canibacter zhuwentaonis]MBT1035789.1 hypothetical protein [Canibacter zhuwentaonis]